MGDEKPKERKLQVRIGKTTKRRGQAIKVGCPCGKGQSVIHTKDDRKILGGGKFEYRRGCSAECGGVQSVPGRLH